MYHYLQDKEFERRIRRYGGEIMQQLCHNLKVDHDIGAQFYPVGSGSRNLITQNENLPVDLDYNLEIVRCDDFDDCKTLKECARKAFDKALNQRNQWNCQDSTSTLTARQIRLGFGHPTFSIDVCITCQDEDGCHHRLIHKKTGLTWQDEYFWNEAPTPVSSGKKQPASARTASGNWYGSSIFDSRICT